uniref:MTOR-associated protein MEAK7 n=1 Tax=Ascaris suum TaxID=6253 RepID=F1KZM7_ASCSU
MGNISGKNNKDEQHTTLDRDVYDALSKRFHTIVPRTDECAFKKFSADCLETKFQVMVYECIVSFCNDRKNLTAPGFIRFAELVLGDYDGQAEAIIRFGKPLRTVVEGVVSSFLICEERANCPESVPLLTDYIMESTGGKNLGKDELPEWLMHSTVFPVFWKQVFKALLLGDHTKVLPPISGRTVLTTAAQSIITLMLPLESRLHWKLLFSSRIHGESFTKMLNAVDGIGPCVIVIETVCGRVFGGFANEGFICGPSYTGDMTCFLFEDRTRLAIHTATGFNQNFAYLNHSQQTLPNGLGLGGMDNNWSLFLCDEFGKGITSANISTFEKCWLAGKNEFTVKSVEAWGIGEPKKRRRYDSEGNEIIEKEMSALDRDPEAVAVLELSGKPMHSDGYREPPSVDDD